MQFQQWSGLMQLKHPDAHLRHFPLCTQCPLAHLMQELLLHSMQNAEQGRHYPLMGAQTGKHCVHYLSDVQIAQFDPHGKHYAQAKQQKGWHLLQYPSIQTEQLLSQFLACIMKQSKQVITNALHSSISRLYYITLQMKGSTSLPSLLTQSKLFPSELDLETSRNEFRQRITSQAARSQSQQRKPARSLIHFQENIEGFASFRSINASKMDQILSSLKGMRSSSTNIGKIVKAEILFNKNQYARIEKYCEDKRKFEREAAINRLAKLEPLPMKKEVKMTEKNRKKIKTTVGLKIQTNYTVYENNRLAWKPYIDFDAMPVALDRKAYFIGGRQPTPLSYYDRFEDKWTQDTLIEGLKPFGESEGTPISSNEVLFFGGSRFFIMGQSLVTNSLTYVNLDTKSARTETYDELTVAPRCFHAQCLYGQYLIISGGIDRKNQLLGKFSAFHIYKKFWFELTIAKVAEKLKQGFAKHKMMPIFLPRKKYNFYEEEPVTCSEAEKDQFKYEGIYIFGGEDANVELSNRLYILTAGKPSIEVFEPQITGRPPEPRKNFDWARIREYLFIHGGRNDEMRPWVLRALSALNLKTMNWLTIKGDKPSFRHSHLLMPTSDDELVILGGKNMEGLCKEVFPFTFTEIVDYL